MVYSWLQNVHSRLSLATCVLCGGGATPAMDLCLGCQGDLPYQSLACPRCALPSSYGGLCGQCLRRPPRFDQAYSVFHYAEPLESLIVALKYNKKFGLARLLGALMGDYLLERVDPPQLILPVPLHPARLRERGYNQALELARPLARRFGLPLDYRSCERTRATAPQSLLPAQQRRRNVRGVFRLSRALEVQHVALVDDVMTTGHTLNEFAAVLKRGGVQRVDVWVCARAALGK